MSGPVKREAPAFRHGEEVTIDGMLRQYVEQGLSPEEAANKTFHAVSKAALAKLVHPLLVLRAQTIQRGSVRSLEKKVDYAIMQGGNPIMARQLLEEESFYVLGKGYVNWLDATVDDHTARAKYQRGQSTACLADAERHENAAQDILNGKVKNLRELGKKLNASHR